MKAKRRPVACIVGTGFIGPVHIEALRRIGIEIGGLVEASPETARAKAEALGIERAYPSYEAALADPGIDVVHLAVPNQLHAPYAKAAIAAGKHVLCEKPLATTSEESAEIAALARESGVVAAVNYNLRFYPLVREARELVASGRLGRPFLIHGSYLQDWLLYDTDWSWRLDPRVGGKLRAVADIGTHWLDMIRFVTGLRVESVFAELSTLHEKRRRPLGGSATFSAGGSGGTEAAREELSVSTEDAAFILMRFESGARGCLSLSQVAAGHKNELDFEIDGTASSLAWDSESPNALWIGERRGPNHILAKDPALLSPAAAALSGYPGGHQEGYPDTFKNIFAAFYAYLEAGDFSAPRDFPTFDDGHEEMLLCDAILESARRGAWTAPRRD